MISELFDQDDFERYNERHANQVDAKPEFLADVQLALASFNKLVQRAGLVAYLDESGRCYLRTYTTAPILIDGKRKVKGEDMTRDRIQQALDTVYREVFNQGQADLYSSLVSGPYIQHNPLFPNELDAIVGYIKQVGRVPCEVKLVAIDGDLAFVHVRYLDWAGKETAGVDIFRFNSDGKIVEHWDVLQPVRASSNNANTMF